MWRAVAAACSVIVASVSGVVTGLETTHSSWGLWTALAVLVLVGALLQGAVSYWEGRPRPIAAVGPGAVAIGGSGYRAVRTRVRIRSVPAPVSDDRDGVIASGAGAVSIGEDAIGPVSADVAEPEGPQ